MVVRSNVWVCGCSLAGIEGSNPPPPGAWISVSCEFVCFQVEVSATGRSLFQRRPTECDVSECDREVSIMGSNTMERKDKVFSILVNTRCKT